VNWTTEFPTKPGWYWVRNLRFNWPSKGETLDGKPSPMAGSVVTIHAPQAVLINESCRIFGVTEVNAAVKDELISAEWYGPIEPPE